MAQVLDTNAPSLPRQGKTPAPPKRSTDARRAGGARNACGPLLLETGRGVREEGWPCRRLIIATIAGKEASATGPILLSRCSAFWFIRRPQAAAQAAVILLP